MSIPAFTKTSANSFPMIYSSSPTGWNFIMFFIVLSYRYPSLSLRIIFFFSFLIENLSNSISFKSCFRNSHLIKSSTISLIGLL